MTTEHARDVVEMPPNHQDWAYADRIDYVGLSSEYVANTLAKAKKLLASGANHVAQEAD